MFEKFTEKAVQVIMIAQERAKQLRQNFVGTEHILLGIVEEGANFAAKVLISKGVTPTTIKQIIEKEN